MFGVSKAVRQLLDGAVLSDSLQVSTFVAKRHIKQQDSETSVFTPESQIIGRFDTLRLVAGQLASLLTQYIDISKNSHGFQVYTFYLVK